MTKTVARRLVPDAKAVKPGGEMRAFLAATKRPTRLIGGIERHLLTRPPGHRPTDVLHPSEIIDKDWCHRASYHLLRGATPKPDRNNLRTSTIFDEGHAIHHKWQTWLQEMGVLYGRWFCLSCRATFFATSPDYCWCCDVAAEFLRYDEVPLVSEKHRIAGHSDGWVKDEQGQCLIEIKSIGLGTVRVEAPHLLAQADGDLEKLWQSIRRPFPKHMRQGQLYLSLAAISEPDPPTHIVFIYENKANQAAREFVVEHDPFIVESLLEDALDIVWAVEHDREPACNVRPGVGCAKCKQFA